MSQEICLDFAIAESTGCISSGFLGQKGVHSDSPSLGNSFSSFGIFWVPYKVRAQPPKLDVLQASLHVYFFFRVS